MLPTHDLGDDKKLKSNSVTVSAVCMKSTTTKDVSAVVADFPSADKISKSKWSLYVPSGCNVF